MEASRGGFKDIDYKIINQKILLQILKYEIMGENIYVNQHNMFTYIQILLQILKQEIGGENDLVINNPARKSNKIF